MFLLHTPYAYSAFKTLASYLSFKRIETVCFCRIGNGGLGGWVLKFRVVWFISFGVSNLSVYPYSLLITLEMSA